MKAKRWLALFIALAMLLSAVSFAVAEEADDEESESIEAVESEEREDAEEAAEEPGVAQQGDEAVALTPCNLRAERDSNSEKLRYIRKNGHVYILEYYDDGWCKILLKSGRIGYGKASWFKVLGKKDGESAAATPAPEESVPAGQPEEAGSEEQEEGTSADGQEENPAPAETAPAETVTAETAPAETAPAEGEEGVVVPANDLAIATTPCNIRNGRSLEAQKIHSCAKGAQVTVVEYYDDGWCKVEYSRDHYGYARINWFKYPYKQVDDIPKDKTPSVDDDPGNPVWDTEGRGSPTFTIDRPDDAEAQISGDEGLDIRQATVIPEGVSIGESDSDEMRYIALTLKKISIYKEPTADSKRLGEIKKGKRMRVLAFGDDWCKIRTWDGQITGYVKSKYVFHYHTMDPFKWKLPFYDSYRPTGYIIVTKPIHVTDLRNLYKGQNLQPGDVITVQLRDDGDYNMLVRRCWTTVPKEYGEYHEFTNWAEAKKGDIIGGGTLFYGLTQGHGSWKNRVYNIKKAMGLMDGVIIGVGKKYSYLKNLGPVTAKNGWKKGGIIHIGNNSGGVGTGGGICHTSSLTYFSVISIPVFIYEREPHLDEGALYMPVEFDATVGAWSDFVFYNILPYDIKQHAFVDKFSGVITVYYECLETKSEEEIANWDWTKLPLPLAKDDR